MWEAADALRGSMDAAEYKHVVLGLIFLKYISDAFEGTHARPLADVDQGADADGQEEYRAHNGLCVPPRARWIRPRPAARRPGAHGGPVA